MYWKSYVFFWFFWKIVWICLFIDMFIHCKHGYWSNPCRNRTRLKFIELSLADIERADDRSESNLRTRMSTKKKYFFFHYNMLDLADWYPGNTSQLFFNVKTCSERHISSTAGRKSRVQACFEGTFSKIMTFNQIFRILAIQNTNLNVNLIICIFNKKQLTNVKKI